MKKNIASEGSAPRPAKPFLPAEAHEDSPWLDDCPICRDMAELERLGLIEVHEGEWHADDLPEEGGHSPGSH